MQEWCQEYKQNLFIELVCILQVQEWCQKVGMGIAGGGGGSRVSVMCPLGAEKT